MQIRIGVREVMHTSIEVQICLENGARFVRQFEKQAPGVMCEIIQSLRKGIQQRVSQIENRPVQVQEIITMECTKKLAKAASRLTISNICGSVTHWAEMSAVHPGVLPLYKRVTNIYGEFYGLHHIHCNIVTSGKNNKTLFRGGRDSQLIMKVLQTVLIPEAVTSMHLHMMVCAGYLGHRVRVSYPTGKYLDERFTTDTRWGATVDYSSEELSSVKCIRIHTFSDPLLESVLSPPLRHCRLMLIHIGAQGFVNMFLTMSPEVNFYVGIENDVMSLFQFFFDFVAESC